MWDQVQGEPPDNPGKGHPICKREWDDESTDRLVEMFLSGALLATETSTECTNPKHAAPGSICRELMATSKAVKTRIWKVMSGYREASSYVGHRRTSRAGRAWGKRDQRALYYALHDPEPPHGPRLPRDGTEVFRLAAVLRRPVEDLHAYADALLRSATPRPSFGLVQESIESKWGRVRDRLGTLLKGVPLA